MYTKKLLSKLTSSSLDYSYENIGVKGKHGRKKKPKPWNVRMDCKK